MKYGKSLLVDGNIPAHTTCPFAGECGLNKDGNCGHQGVNHTVDYSCALARAFDLRHRTSGENDNA